jgi:hypothetical protein
VDFAAAVAIVGLISTDFEQSKAGWQVGGVLVGAADVPVAVAAGWLPVIWAEIRLAIAKTAATEKRNRILVCMMGEWRGEKREAEEEVEEDVRWRVE